MTITIEQLQRAVDEAGAVFHTKDIRRRHGWSTRTSRTLPSRVGRALSAASSPTRVR